MEKLFIKKREKILPLQFSDAFNQDSEKTKKISSFLIMTFERHFSLILVQLFEANLLTLSVVKTMWITFPLALVFNSQGYMRVVDNLFTNKNLM